MQIHVEQVLPRWGTFLGSASRFLGKDVTMTVSEGNGHVWVLNACDRECVGYRHKPSARR
jgi:hypothetical protein